jgi:hypothetical protein
MVLDPKGMPAIDARSKVPPIVNISPINPQSSSVSVIAERRGRVGRGERRGGVRDIVLGILVLGILPWDRVWLCLVPESRMIDDCSSFISDSWLRLRQRSIELPKFIINRFLIFCLKPSGFIGSITILAPCKCVP